MIDEYQVIYSPDATNDLRNVFLYIAYELGAPTAARNYVKRISQMIHSSELMPDRHPIIDWEPWKKMQVRRVSVGNFVIFYKVGTDQVIVIRIVYGGQNITNILEE